VGGHVLNVSEDGSDLREHVGHELATAFEDFFNLGVATDHLLKLETAILESLFQTLPADEVGALDATAYPLDLGTQRLVLQKFKDFVLFNLAAERVVVKGRSEGEGRLPGLI
jgi:hypothetical protein